MNTPHIAWPQGKRFAFTIFDDPDAQTLSQCREVYSFLSDAGFRTTIGVWVLEPGESRRNSEGETCANPIYRAWAQELQSRGFEIGFHNAAPATMTRDEIVTGLDRFREYFGSDPVTMANHYNGDAMYWGPARLTGGYRALYQAATLGRSRNRHFGEKPGHESYWGDVCKSRVRYCRNFVFRELNTLMLCPWMPYSDPDRPLVNYWYASADGTNCRICAERVSDDAVERLEADGGAAILYTHFGHGYFSSGGLDTRFQEIMRRLSKRNGWFVPVSTLLRFLESQGKGQPITSEARSQMERRWLWSKLFYGTS